MQKPYLGLHSRLSQTWINKYTILLILISIKIFLFKVQLANSIDLLKNLTLQSCPNIDSYSSELISLPHYLTKSANYFIKKSVSEINEKSIESIELLLSVTQSLILFTLEMVIGTYTCVLVSAIDGSVDVAVNSTEKIIGWVNNSLDGLTNDIEDGLTDLSRLLNKAVSAYEDVKDFFDGDDDQNNRTISNINLTVSSIKNLKIPSSINTNLEKLRDNTPDFQTVKNDTEKLINYPFYLIKNKIQNKSLLSLDNDNSSVLLYESPIQNSYICSDNSDKIFKFYKDLSNDISLVARILIIILVLLSIVLILPVIFQQCLYYKKLVLLKSSLDSNIDSSINKPDPIEVFESTFHKTQHKVGVKVSKLFKHERQTNVRWLVSYILSSRALIVLMLSICGFLSVLLQYLILVILKRSMSKNSFFFKDIKSEFQSKLSDSITSWTDSTNHYLSYHENSINDDLFTSIKYTTSELNSTVAEFVTKMDSAIARTFNNTILYNPVKSIVGCVIENKLIKIEKGLTWINGKAHISFPRVNDTYIYTAFDTNGNSTANTTTNATNKIQNLTRNLESSVQSSLKLIISQYEHSLMIEVYISIGLFVIWFSQLIIGLVIILITNYRDSNLSSPALAEKNISYPIRIRKDINPFSDKNML